MTVRGRIRSLATYPLLGILWLQVKLLRLRLARDERRVEKVQSAPIWQQMYTAMAHLEKIRKTHAEILYSLETHGAHITAEQTAELSLRQELLLSEALELTRRNEPLVASAQVFIDCEVDPLIAQVATSQQVLSTLEAKF